MDGYHRRMIDGLRIVPANAASSEELAAIFGTRGSAAICQCQRYKLRPRESFGSFPAEERAYRLHDQTNCGDPTAEAYPMRTELGEIAWEEIHVGAQSIFADAGMTEISRPGKRRLVMRIDFDSELPLA